MIGPCPDPDVIAGFCDRTLDAAERTRWEAHFADCAGCQQVLGVMARLEERLPAAQPSRAPAQGWHVRWSWAWMAPAAAVVAFGVLWSVIGPSLLAPGLSSPAPSADATMADRDLAVSRPEPLAAAPAREEAVREPRDAAPVRPARTPAQVGATAAPRAPGGRDEAAKAEAAMAKTVAAEQANVARAYPVAPGVAGAAGVVGGAVRAPESAKPVERVAPSDRMQARGQAAEPQAAAMQVMPAAAPAPTVTVVSPAAAAMWRLGPSGLIERSTDRGLSWQRQESGVRAALVAGSSPSPAVCWVVGRQGTVLRTVDGLAWEVVAPPSLVDLVQVTARDGLSATVTAVDGRRYVTFDGGRTWLER